MNSVSLPSNSPKIGAKERARLTHQFLTDHPNAKIGSVVPYENRNHFYLVEVFDVGSYGFMARIPLTEKNRSKINAIRKGYKGNE
jgi:hypothetical protein